MNDFSPAGLLLSEFEEISGDVEQFSFLPNVVPLETIQDTPKK
jgi:hypothetical protein